MATLDELLDAIAAAPPGPQVAAFFDYDGTLIDGFSAVGFYRHRLRRAEIGPLELADTLLGAGAGSTASADFEEFLTIGLRALGAGAARTRCAGSASGCSRTRSRAALLPGGLAAGARRTTRWATRVVLASSATRFQLEPLRARLGIDHVLCTPVEITRRHRSPAAPPGRRCGARARRARSRAFARPSTTSTSTTSYALLQRQRGRRLPRARSGTRPRATRRPRWCAIAHERDWPILRFAPRPRDAGPGRCARTVGCLRRDGRRHRLRRRRRSALLNGARARRWTRRHRRRGLRPGARRRRHRRRHRRGDRAPLAAAARACSCSTTRASSTRSSSRSCCAASFTGRGEEGGAPTSRASGRSSGSPAWRSSTAATRGKAREALTPAVDKLRGRYLARHRARGHALADAAARPVQEGRLPPRDAGGGADRADRHPQRRRAHVARRPGLRPGDDRGRASCRRSTRRLAARDHGRPRRGGARHVPRDPEELADRARPPAEEVAR